MKMALGIGKKLKTYKYELSLLISMFNHCYWRLYLCWCSKEIVRRCCVLCMGMRVGKRPTAQRFGKFYLSQL